MTMRTTQTSMWKDGAQPSKESCWETSPKVVKENKQLLRSTCYNSMLMPNYLEKESEQQLKIRRSKRQKERFAQKNVSLALRHKANYILKVSKSGGSILQVGEQAPI